MSEVTTQNIRVRVESEYLAGESQPENNAFYFAYHVKIANEGDSTVQLLSRRWVITDANGRTEEVQGPGVIGLQPIIKPGEYFTYSSYCPLPTPLGSMHGAYQMVKNGRELFDAKIAPFTLAVPGILQ